jgi:hypothetical protein
MSEFHHSTPHLIQSLANDPRANLETHARPEPLCPARCNRYPCPCRLRSGLEFHSSQSGQRGWHPSPSRRPSSISRPPDLGSTPPHPNKAATAVVSLFKLEAAKHADYSMASNTLNTALLAIGQHRRGQHQSLEDDPPCPEDLHALSTQHTRHHACQAWYRY